jgi:hypothetical protein
MIFFFPSTGHPRQELSPESSKEFNDLNTSATGDKVTVDFVGVTEPSSIVLSAFGALLIGAVARRRAPRVRPSRSGI